MHFLHKLIVKGNLVFRKNFWLVEAIDLLYIRGHFWGCSLLENSHVPTNNVNNFWLSNYFGLKFCELQFQTLISNFYFNHCCLKLNFSLKRCTSNSLHSFLCAFPYYIEGHKENCITILMCMFWGWILVLDDNDWNKSLR